MRTVVYTPIAGQSIQMPDHEVQHLDLPSLIKESHIRSESYGLNRKDVPDFSPQSPASLSRGLEENKFLLQHAMPVMETLHDQIANTHNMVLLTASNGLVLHSLGDFDFLEKAMQVALVPGVNWSEKSKGTNAIGTALEEELPVTIHGNEHFMHANEFLTCSCAPVFDPYGQVIGALDVTGDQRNFHQHTMALVRMSVQMIENHMFADIFPTAVRMHFHARSEFLGTLVEGIVVFSHEGRFLSANRSAQFQLGMSFNALKGHTFSSLFDMPISRLHELRGNALAKPQQFCLHNGVAVWCRVKMKQPSLWSTGPTFEPAPSSPLKSDQAGSQPGKAFPPDSPSASAPARKVQLSTLHYLNTGDPQLAAVIQKLSMVRGRDIPIMILGETGTGKDLLAQAIHGDSNRAGQPFVSVNCASIPETLIESELFGYEEGAFTGAKKKGAIGKIQQASGGTLFLDEIGDMPRHLQARLLRVLQDRKISPLGAGKEIEVDVAVICATNKNLKEMIAQGEFREDLYYRLNGLVVRLPALRHRTDFEVVMQKILKSLCENGAAISISADVMNLFTTHTWPGNFRQLHNLLRTAVVMVGCEGGVIQRAHLPDDFLEEHVHQVAVQAPSGAPETPQPMVVPDPQNGQRLQDVALIAMTKMLQHHKGNVSAAAKALGVSRNTVYRRKEQLPPDVWN